MIRTDPLLTVDTVPQSVREAIEAGAVFFKPEEWQKNVMRDISPVVLLTGSGGGGKSRVGYEKMVAFALRYPGSNCLALRKELDDCNRSIVPTLDDHILVSLMEKVEGQKPRVIKKASSRCYYFDNGSRLWWGGMRNVAERKAIRSMGAGGGLDFILMEEAIEFDEEDYDEVKNRLRGMAAPWRQLIIMTNPDAPLHWINRRLIVGGEASVYLSSADDNPYVPKGYAQQLRMMPGVEGARLGRGLWIDGTGLVIDTWQNAFNLATGEDFDGNVSLAAEYVPGGGRIVMGVDDGYTGEYDPKAKMFTASSHPRVFILAQIRPTGQICVFAEDYAIKERYQTQIKRVMELCQSIGCPRPTEVHYDKASATLKGELETAALHPLYPSTSRRDESIKLMNERVAIDVNRFRGVLVHPRCRHLILEMSSWSLKDGQPTKVMDHGCDALRYIIWNTTHGSTGEGALGVKIDNADVLNRIEEKINRIDQIMDGVDSKLGVGL